MRSPEGFSQERPAGKPCRNGKFILLGAWISVGRGALCIEECRNAPVSGVSGVHHCSPLASTPPLPPLSSCEGITTVHPRFILKSQNASHILISCLLFLPLPRPPCFSHHMEAKIGPAAFLWPFCPCSGRRLAHRGSCYNFHFLKISLFFPLCGTKTGTLSVSAVRRWREQDGSSDSDCCHSNSDTQKV